MSFSLRHPLPTGLRDAFGPLNYTLPQCGPCWTSTFPWLLHLTLYLPCHQPHLVITGLWSRSGYPHWIHCAFGCYVTRLLSERFPTPSSPLALLPFPALTSLTPDIHHSHFKCLLSSACVPAHMDSPALNICWIAILDELLSINAVIASSWENYRELDWCSHCDGKFFGWLCGGWFPSLCGTVVYFVSWQLARVFWDRLFLSIFWISVSTAQCFLFPALVHTVTQPWLSLSLCWTLWQFFSAALLCGQKNYVHTVPKKELQTAERKKQESCLLCVRRPLHFISQNSMHRDACI